MTWTDDWNSVDWNSVPLSDVGNLQWHAHGDGFVFRCLGTIDYGRDDQTEDEFWEARLIPQPDDGWEFYFCHTHRDGPQDDPFEIENTAFALDAQKLALSEFTEEYRRWSENAEEDFERLKREAEEEDADAEGSEEGAFSLY